jgi:hypothetical protein
MARSAKQWVARLRQTVDAFYADRITYADFDRRQRATWDAIARAGMAEDVTAILCQ